MICDCRVLTERLRDNKTLTDKDIWEMEQYEKCGCSSWKEFSETLTKYRVKRQLKRQALEQPTTQEQDRKSFWSKVRKK